MKRFNEWRARARNRAPHVADMVRPPERRHALQRSTRAPRGHGQQLPDRAAESPRVSWRLRYLEPDPVGTGVSG
jgi:hypothetical protein